VTVYDGFMGIIRKLVIVATLMLAAATPARAEVGIGFILGKPTGLDLKIDIARRSALDMVAGWYPHWRYFDNGGYFHLQWLYQPWEGHGDKVLVPLRLGVGGAIFDDRNYFHDGHDIDLGVRFPFEVGIRFRGTPVEIYAEIALMFVFFHPNEPDYGILDLNGGVGLRFMF